MAAWVSEWMRQLDWRPQPLPPSQVQGPVRLCHFSASLVVPAGLTPLGGMVAHMSPATPGPLCTSTSTLGTLGSCVSGLPSLPTQPCSVCLYVDTCVWGPTGIQPSSLPHPEPSEALLQAPGLIRPQGNPVLCPLLTGCQVLALAESWLREHRKVPVSCSECRCPGESACL